MVSDLFSSLVRRELHCTHFCTWRLPQEQTERPIRATPGHQRTCRQWALLLSLEFYTLLLVRPVANSHPAACFAQSAETIHGGLWSLRQLINTDSSLVDGTCYYQGSLAVDLPCAKSGPEVTYQNFMGRTHVSEGQPGLLGWPPLLVGSNSLSPFSSHTAMAHLLIPHTDSASGTVSKTFLCSQLTPVSHLDTSSLNQICETWLLWELKIYIYVYIKTFPPTF